MDLSKAYDCLPHGLLIKTFKAMDLILIAFAYCIASYLDCRHQRVKIGSLKSTAKSIEIGIPQGSVLGPLLLTYS